MTHRVAHVLRKYDPAEWGGTETHVVEVTRRLVRHSSWRPEVHAPAGPDRPDSALDPDVPLVRYHAHNPFVGSSEARRALVRNAGNILSFDEPIRLAWDRGLALAHVHTQGRIGGAVRTAMQLTGRPYVVSIHGPALANPAFVATDTARRLANVWDLGRPFGALFGARRVINDAARVISFNDEEHHALQARIGGRAVRMDHGVDVARLSAGDLNRARARWPQFGDAPLVGLVGRLAEQKNQVLAVRAFARGAPADHHLVLAGAETDRGYRAQIEAAAREVGVADRVHLLGNVDSRTEIPDLFARISMLIVPSTHEAFGLAVLEGWAAGRAVLFANHTGMADIARAFGPEATAVPTLDERDWSAAIQRLLAHPEEREASARRGAALVRDRYTWETSARRLAALYDTVLQEHGTVVAQDPRRDAVPDASP